MQQCSSCSWVLNNLQALLHIMITILYNDCYQRHAYHTPPARLVRCYFYKLVVPPSSLINRYKLQSCIGSTSTYYILSLYLLVSRIKQCSAWLRFVRVGHGRQSSRPWPNVKAWTHEARLSRPRPKRRTPSKSAPNAGSRQSWKTLVSDRA